MVYEPSLGSSWLSMYLCRCGMLKNDEPKTQKSQPSNLSAGNKWCNCLASVEGTSLGKSCFIRLGAANLHASHQP